MFFSIIVPVYKVENYLSKCLDSILKQSFGDFEAILVDDGSPDCCPAICDIYAKKDRRIKVIHKKNGGLSDARNCGVNYSFGDYVVFVDSDDFIEPFALEKFRNAIIKYKNPDVLLTTFIENYKDKEIIEDQHMDAFFLKKSVDKNTILDWAINHSKNSAPAQLKICHRSFLIDNKIVFSVGRLHEDIDWTTNLYFYAKSFGVCSYPWYHHKLDREGQITSSIKLKNIIDVIEMGENHYSKAISKNGMNHLISKYYFIRIYRILSYAKYLNSEDYQFVIKTIKKHKHLYSFKIAPKAKYKLFTLIMHLFGISFSLKLFTVFK